MNNASSVRPCDTVTISDVNAVLYMSGGSKCDGVWKVISIHNDFIALSRGGRLARVKHQGVTLHKKQEPVTELPESIDDE